MSWGYFEQFSFERRGDYWRDCSWWYISDRRRGLVYKLKWFYRWHGQSKRAHSWSFKTLKWESGFKLKILRSELRVLRFMKENARRIST